MGFRPHSTLISLVILPEETVFACMAFNKLVVQILLTHSATPGDTYTIQHTCVHEGTKYLRRAYGVVYLLDWTTGVDY